MTREELHGVGELWVDAALRLGERELKIMSRLTRAQARRMRGGQADDPAAADQSETTLG